MMLTRPVYAYDMDGRPIGIGHPDLSQEFLDEMHGKSIVSVGENPLHAARLWILRPGVRLADIKVSERHTAHVLLRAGYSLILASPCARTEEAVREDLLELIARDNTPRGGSLAMRNRELPRTVARNDRAEAAR